MLQKPEDIRQERFLEEVNKLNLRFPGKEIVARTGYKSGIVSEYLNGKKKVSESFLKAFCKSFDIEYDSVFSLNPFPADDPLNWERAKIIALERRLALFMSAVYELQGKRRTYEECLDDIDNDTEMILADLRRSGKR